MYAFMILSHRVLRYLSPFLHLVTLGTSIALLGHGWVYAVALGIQVAVLAASILVHGLPIEPEQSTMITSAAPAPAATWAPAVTDTIACTASAPLGR